MTTHEPSATIYAFPAGGRPRVHTGEQRTGTTVVASIAQARACRREQQAAARPEAPVVCTGAWYHEAAMREASQR